MSDQKTIISACAKGNTEAEVFLWTLLDFVHLIDDLVDQDKPRTADQVAEKVILFVGMLIWNRFFSAFKDQLYPLMVQAAAAWADSENLKDTAPEGITVALKSLYHEVFWHTAFLCGGWGHMRKMQQEFREWDFEVKER